MTGRIVRLALAAASGLVLAGCIAPPPSGWVPPVVTTTVNPDPVVAGEPFTVDVTATDVTSVTSIDIHIQPPIGISTSTIDWRDVDCDAGPFTPGPSAARSFACALPAHAPNGVWRLRAEAGSAGGNGYIGSMSSTFDVTGGSDDTQAPVLDSVEISPNPVIIGEPFSITVRGTDANHAAPAPTAVGASIVLPAPPEGTVRWTCSPTTPTPVGETVLEWRFTDCLIPAGSSAWTYAGSVRVEDAFGYYGHLSFSFQAVSG